MNTQTLRIDAKSRALKNVIDMGPIDKAQLAENIRTGRAKLNENRVVFAKKTGISTNTLRSLENGTHARTPDLHTIEKIAKRFNTTPQRLLTGKLPITGDDPLLHGLSREDIRIARAFHDTILDVKSVVRALLTSPLTEETREHFALTCLRLLRLEPEALDDLEVIIEGLEEAQRTRNDKRRGK